MCLDVIPHVLDVPNLVFLQHTCATSWKPPAVLYAQNPLPFTCNHMAVCLQAASLDMRSMNATAFAVIVLLCLTGAKAKRGLLQEEASAPTGSQAPTTVLSASAPTAGPAGGLESPVATPQSAPASIALPAPAQGPPALGADVAPAPSNPATASVTAAPSQSVSDCLCLFTLIM